MMELHRIFQTPMVRVNNFWFLRLGELSWTLFRLLWSLCFAWIGLNPLSGNILNNDSVRVIVLWFIILIEDFVICKAPLSFKFASRLRNLGLLGSEYKYCAFPWLWYLFFGGRSESESWDMSAGACNSVSSRLSVNSSNHSGSCRKRSSESRLSSLFLLFVFGVRWSATLSWS